MHTKVVTDPLLSLLAHAVVPYNIVVLVDTPVDIATRVDQVRDKRLHSCRFLRNMTILILMQTSVLSVVFVALHLTIFSLQLCRHHQPAIKFIYASARGLFGFAFSDFGPSYTINDETGETIKVR